MAAQGGFRDYFGFKLKPGEHPDRISGLDLRFSCGCLPQKRAHQLKLLWHFGLFASSLSAFIYTFYISSEPPKYLTFLTSWGLCLSALTFTLQFTYSLYRNCRPHNDAQRLSRVEEILLFLHNVIFPITSLITLFYWLLLFPGLPEEARAGKLDDKLLGHGLLPLLLLVDLLVFSTRITRWQHLYQPLLVGLSWVIFSAVYFAFGGTGYVKHAEKGATVGKPYIYGVINWTQPGKTIGIVIGVGLGLIVLHLLICFIDFVLNKFACRSSSSRRNEDQVDDEAGIPLQEATNGKIQIVLIQKEI